MSARPRSGFLVLMVLVATLIVAGLAAATAPSQAGTTSPHDTSDPGDSSVVAVSAGGEFTCEIHADHSMWCYGRNTYGQLGNGHMGPGSSTPTRVVGDHAWKQVAAGGSTTCAVTTSHALYCWGLDHRGQLGDGSTHAVATPKKVQGTSQWASVATAWFHTCAVKTNHQLWCWGDNSAGELGHGNTKQDRKLHQVPGSWSTVAVAGWNTCAIKTDRSLWCWGRNLFGQLGTGSAGDRSQPTRVGTSTGWRQISLSWTHACGLLGSGVAKCWGRNDLGQVGGSSATYVNHPVTVAGAHQAVSVAVAEGSSCLVDTAGATWCWGDNRYGQVSPQQPVTPGARTPVQRTSAGPGDAVSVTGGWFHLCALQASDTTSCWGGDGRGQLGASGPSQPGTPVTPPVVKKQTGGPLSFRLASFNTLGNHHTQPGRDADNFAPSPMRADWEAQMILNQGIQVAGIEEQDAGQLAGILNGAQGRLASFPTPAAGDLGVETSVVWDTRYFRAVKTTYVRTPFIARNLKRPVVKLQQLSTGREFWLMAVHNAPWSYQSKRNAEAKIEIARLQKLEQSNLPVFFVGDFNEKATILCKVLEQTGLGSASGGHLSNGRCIPPRQQRVDWIFGSKALVDWSGFSFTKPPLARLSTDHYVPVVDVTAP